MIVLCVSIISAGSALAASEYWSVEKEMPVRAVVVEVQDMNPDLLRVYNDLECTEPVETLNFGEVRWTNPTRNNLKVYLRNESALPMDLYNMYFSDLPREIGCSWTTFNPEGHYTRLIPAGEILILEAWLRVTKETTPGTYDTMVLHLNGEAGQHLIPMG